MKTSGRLFLISVFMVCGLIHVHNASADAYYVDQRRWFSGYGLNAPLHPGEVVQKSSVVTYGWNTSSDVCVQNFFSGWNGLSNYYITSWTPSMIYTNVDWEVGDVSMFSGQLGAVTQERLLSPYSEVSPVPGRQCNDISAAWVTFNERKFFQDNNGVVQGPVRNWDGDTTAYRIDYITVHESGHIAGIDDVYFTSPSVVEYYAYPHNYGVISPSDKDTIFYNYNTRQF